MIRKPDAREFRESGTVSAIRDARTIAKEGARGIQQGTSSFFSWTLGLLMAFGFLMSALSSMGGVGSLLFGGLVIAGFVAFKNKGPAQLGLPAGDHLAARAVMSGADAANGRYEISVGACARRAATLAVPAILLFPTSTLSGALAPLTLIGLALLLRASLLMKRLKGDRAMLYWDSRAVTVRPVQGEATMLWSDVEDVSLHTFSRFNLRVAFTSGARHNLLIRGRRNRLGGPTTLMVPIDLLALEGDSLVSLIDKLDHLHDRAPDDQEMPVQEPAIIKPTPAGLSADAPFDPDAIMTRYLGERAELVASERPDLTVARKPVTFGRKVVQR